MVLFFPEIDPLRGDRGSLRGIFSGPIIQGCSSACLAVSRFLGSNTRSDSMNCLASTEILAQTLGSNLQSVFMIC